jgi:16S rRNA U1498 N3-methylase RsmE
MLLGEHLLIQNQNGQLFVAVLKSSGHDSLNFVLENPVAVLQALASRFEILQALPKEKALNLILQNTT